jgi:hypothetical protein
MLRIAWSQLGRVAHQLRRLLQLPHVKIHSALHLGLGGDSLAADGMIFQMIPHHLLIGVELGRVRRKKNQPQTILNGSYGILNHCDYPIHTRVLEGVNNKIKVIKRKAYGIHDIRYFTLKIYQAFCN